MIRYLTYEEDGDKVTVDTVLRKGEGDILSGMSNFIRPDGAKKHRHQFIFPTLPPKKVWVVVATRISTYAGQSSCRNEEGEVITTISYHDPPQRWNTVHGPFTNKEEFKKKYDEVVWHYLDVEDNNKYDLDVEPIVGMSVDEFEATYNEYRKDCYENHKHYDLLALTIPIWYTHTTLENRKEWCRRDIQKRLNGCNGLRRKQAEGLSEEEKQIVEELGGEKLTDELLESVRRAHPEKTFVVSSGCSDAVARWGHINLHLRNGYVWSIEPHW